MDDVVEVDQLERPEGAVSGEASGVVRTAPTPEQGRAQYVAQWCKRVKMAKAHFSKDFERMRRDMEYAREGADKAWVNGGNYIANITQRHLNNSVAALYAKNPRAFAKRRRRLEYQLWDGNPESYQQAVEAMMLAQQAGAALQSDPFSAGPEAVQAVQAGQQAAEIIREVETVRRQNQMLDKVGKTLEILFNYFLSEQEPSFKKQMKQMVRRAKVTGVGFVEIGFQRLLEKRPEISDEIADATNQIATIERLMQDVQDGKVKDDSLETERLRTAIASLQEQESIIAREGLTFRFPKTTDVIVDVKCRNLATFVGAEWIAIESFITPERVQEAYNVDFTGAAAYTRYTEDGEPQLQSFDEDSPKRGLVRTWRVQDKSTGTHFVIADGYADYLSAPKAPDVKLERFFTVRALLLNDVEHDSQLYPYSDVHYMKPMQDELNRSRQGLREHKHANRPAYVAPRGRLEEADKDNLRSRPSNAIIELSSLNPGESVEKLLQPVRPVGIDPNVYETNPVFEDMLRVVGVQEANLGPLSGGSATESAISEGGRATTQSSDIDELDDLLSGLASDASQIMLLELNAETVKEIAGNGAVWPEYSREQVVKQVFLQVKAGSSGRPNRASELANLERGMPFVLQLPGINPVPLAKNYLELLDIEIDDAIAEGLPSIIALNSAFGRQSQAPTGDPATDPGSQGGRGGEVNAPKQLRDEPGAQPGFPA